MCSQAATFIYFSLELVEERTALCQVLPEEKFVHFLPSQSTLEIAAKSAETAKFYRRAGDFYRRAV